MITWAMAMATAPSVPGLTAIHSPALAAVSERRGSNTTSLAPRFKAALSSEVLRWP